MYKIKLNNPRTNAPETKAKILTGVNWQPTQRSEINLLQSQICCVSMLRQRSHKWKRKVQRNVWAVIANSIRIIEFVHAKEKKKTKSLKIVYFRWFYSFHWTKFCFSFFEQCSFVVVFHKYKRTNVTFYQRTVISIFRRVMLFSFSFYAWFQFDCSSSLFVFWRCKWEIVFFCAFQMIQKYKFSSEKSENKLIYLERIDLRFQTNAS